MPSLNEQWNQHRETLVRQQAMIPVRPEIRGPWMKLRKGRTSLGLSFEPAPHRG
jgi:hypothetical protein